MPEIYLLDVTNRDGVQTAKLGLSKLEKTMINIYLNEMGVFQSEFGFPTTRHETNYLRANLELAEIGVLKPIRLEGWIRAIVEDVETAFQRIPNINHLNLSISTSEQMINGKFQGRKKKDDIIKDMTEAEKYSFAKILKKILMKLNTMLNDPPYNILFHFAPDESDCNDLHFHVEICPRLAKWAGFEFGSGVVINTMAPEDAAEFYRI